jgi:hypothetical protein
MTTSVLGAAVFSLLVHCHKIGKGYWYIKPGPTPGPGLLDLAFSHMRLLVAAARKDYITYCSTLDICINKVVADDMPTWVRFCRTRGLFMYPEELTATNFGSALMVPTRLALKAMTSTMLQVMAAPEDLFPGDP